MKDGSPFIPKDFMTACKELARGGSDRRASFGWRPALSFRVIGHRRVRSHDMNAGAISGLPSLAVIGPMTAVTSNAYGNLAMEIAVKKSS